MAKELVILSWCDVCQDEDVRTEGRSYTLGIGNGRLLEVELCDRHGKPVEEVIELLSAHGKPPTDALPTPGKRAAPAAAPAAARPVRGPRAGAAPKEGALFCLLCDAGYAHAPSLRNHYKNNHGLPSSLGDLYGLICPECNTEGTSFRALNMHMLKAHRVEHIAAAVRSSDDPYGVIADRVKVAEDRAAGTLL